MKTINLFSTLIFCSLTCANIIHYPGLLLKRKVSYDHESWFNALTEECKIEYETNEYNKCIPSINLKNYKESCSTIRTEECHNYYKDPLKYHPKCKGIPEFDEVYQPDMIKTVVESLDIYCQTDENDEICPFSLQIMRKSSLDYVLDSQCKSEKCTKSFYNIFRNMKKDQYASYESKTFTSGSYSAEEMAHVDFIISYLESDECKSLYDKSNVKSNAIILHSNTILFISLSLLLSLIFYI
ncbi:hypothetical protein BCR36DRAFT_587106 [Piromyces finnis]|uniref:Uncharacterized protein n=1 Tax=Piromyces finnis TaxID=1754191 RepID=A0A1Y1UX18_9FUNG|nr:hypothetical protein BCR36DRAFT_587106 [Piromyces finnis]|eukprot:ORX42667.1 hypothetical protein BCR36DRAFT_587106 [Piromyces finnis]